MKALIDFWSQKKVERLGSYSSVPETWEHIGQVIRLLTHIQAELGRRARNHDRTKLVMPELSYFDKYTPLLQSTIYGSDQYKRFLQELKPALNFHYAANRHHPEHHTNGVNDMNLIDLVEMVCDWLAATRRHKEGNAYESLKINKNRFELSGQLAGIIYNTLKVMEEWD